MRRLVRAVVIVIVLAVIELVLARVLAANDPVAALVTGHAWLPFLFVPLYGLRLFLYFVVPPWLAVRLVALVTGRARSS